VISGADAEGVSLEETLQDVAAVSAVIIDINFNKRFMV
jgi:hypothetical protein